MARGSRRDRHRSEHAPSRRTSERRRWPHRGWVAGRERIQPIDGCAQAGGCVLLRFQRRHRGGQRRFGVGGYRRRRAVCARKGSGQGFGHGRRRGCRSGRSLRPIRRRSFDASRRSARRRSLRTRAGEQEGGHQGPRGLERRRGREMFLAVLSGVRVRPRRCRRWAFIELQRWGVIRRDSVPIRKRLPIFSSAVSLRGRGRGRGRDHRRQGHAHVFHRDRHRVRRRRHLRGRNRVQSRGGAG